MSLTVSGKNKNMLLRTVIKVAPWEGSAKEEKKHHHHTAFKVACYLPELKPIDLGHFGNLVLLNIKHKSTAAQDFTS